MIIAIGPLTINTIWQEYFFAVRDTIQIQTQ